MRRIAASILTLTILVAACQPGAGVAPRSPSSPSASLAKEQVFRFNARGGSDADRFTAALSRVMGKRLTYRELTNGAIAAAA